MGVGHVLRDAGSASLAMGEPEGREWKPEPKCCWCACGFREEEIDGRDFFVCITPACRDRQLARAMKDTNGRTFYVPIPRLVSLRDAIDSQQFSHICIGGERGGGKSVGVRRIAQDLCQKFENFSVLFLRRTFPDLYRNHMKFAPREAKQLGSSYGKPYMKWPNGSELEYGHCFKPDDWEGYVGSEADLIVFEQVERFTEQQVTEIATNAGRIRRKGWRGLALCTENPNGPIAAFVDELFISKSIDRTRYPQYDPDKYHFVRAELDDNPNAAEGYTDFLAGVEPIKRDMYRFGNREHWPGQFFGAFNPDQHVRA